MLLYNDITVHGCMVGLGENNYMRYSFVPKSKYKPYKLLWDEILKKMQKELRKNKKITMEIFLTGSGKGKYLTKDENGFFDLDYNLLIYKLPDEYRNNPQKLKDVIRITIDRIKKESYGKYDISFGKDSTVPITYMLKERNKPVMGVDVAIITENPKTGNVQRLIHKKKNGENRFIWNESKLRHSDLKEKLKEINNRNLKEVLHARYLKKKNSINPNNSSYIMFYETVNEVMSLSKGK